MLAEELGLETCLLILRSRLRVAACMHGRKREEDGPARSMDTQQEKLAARFVEKQKQADKIAL